MSLVENFSNRIAVVSPQQKEANSINTCHKSLNLMQRLCAWEKKSSVCSCMHCSLRNFKKDS